MSDGGYRPAMGDRSAPGPGGWAAPQGGLVKRADAPDGLAVGVDFPFVCEVCLGPNPYVRMVKLPFGDKLCKISQRPYQAFRWRAGPGGRWKETIVSPECAKDKNVCQACLSDMTFGVPVGVRDALLEHDPSVGALAPVTSDKNTAFYWQQKDALTQYGGGAAAQLQGVEPSRQLLTLARSLQGQEHRSRTAWRNLPRLCSFWLAGTCSRVVNGRCPFRPCSGCFEFPEIASSHRDLKDQLVERLKGEGATAVMRTLDSETREAIQGALKGNKDEAIRKRFDGNDDLSKRYLRRARESAPELEKPKDASVTSLWVGGLEPPLTEQDLRDVFYAYGEIRSIRALREKRCAFVEFTTRDAAEAAAQKLHRNLVVRGLKLDLDWAKPASLSGPSSDGQGGAAASSSTGGALPLPPPPGMAPNAAMPMMPAAMHQRLAQASGVAGVPPPPPGPPPPAAVQQGPAKRQRTDPAVGPAPMSLPPPPPGPPPPIAFQHPAASWRPVYPSMDPQRMGAKPGAPANMERVGGGGGGNQRGAPAAPGAAST